MKEHNKVSARDPSETHISNMTNGEFKATDIRILAGLEKRVEDFREVLITEIKELKRNQSEMKTAITEIGNRTDAMNTRLEETEE